MFGMIYTTISHSDLDLRFLPYFFLYFTLQQPFCQSLTSTTLIPTSSLCSHVFSPCGAHLCQPLMSPSLAVEVSSGQHLLLAVFPDALKYSNTLPPFSSLYALLPTHFTSTFTTVHWNVSASTPNLHYIAIVSIQNVYRSG
jgi:hypothetical protein